MKTLDKLLCYIKWKFLNYPGKYKNYSTEVKGAQKFCSCLYMYEAVVIFLWTFSTVKYKYWNSFFQTNWKTPTYFCRKVFKAGGPNMFGATNNQGPPALDLLLKTLISSPEFNSLKEKNWTTISRMIPGTTARQVTEIKYFGITD